MSTQVQRRKGTTVQHSTFTGASAELTVDTTKNTVVVHDGATAGGIPLAKETGSALSATSLTLPNGTANAVAFLNGSKVLTSGTALTFNGTNLGIGTTTPVVKLEIAGTTSQTWIVTASISGVTMDVTVVSSGTIAVGDLVFGANIQPYTRVTALGTGTGGVGTYTVSVSQTAASASVLGGANYGATLVRITETDTSQNPGQPTGALQFFTSDASSPTAGVGAYVAALSESLSPDTALVFGTRDNAVGGVDANERARIESSGRFIVGHSASIQAAQNTNIQSQATGGQAGVSAFRWSNDAIPPRFQVGKSRSATIGTNTIVQSGDELGGLYFYGDDGTDLVSDAASIVAAVDGTPGTNDMPGRLVFSTTADGSATPTERMRITSDGTSIWNVAGSETMRLTSTGLGIGTTSPQSRLHVSGPGNAEGIIDAPGGTSILSLVGTAAAGGLIAYKGTSLRIGSATGYGAAGFVDQMRLDTSGNLGLGVTPAATWATNRKVLQVGGLAGAAVALTGTGGSGEIFYNSYFNTSSANIYNVSSYAGKTDFNIASAGGFTWQLAPSGTAGNAITFTQAMTLDASGNLLVGTTATYGGPGRINVGFNQSTNFGITLRNTNATATGVFVSFENSGGTGNGSISQTNSTTVAYNTSSDRRLKTAITPAVDAGSDIDAIQVVSHGWVSNDDHVKYGVIAQDLVSVAPQAVRQGDDGAEVTETWGVDYSKLVPMLVKELQSLRARVASLESK